MKAFNTVSAAMLLFASSAAMADPPGLKGQDWDEVVFKIQGDAIVEINGMNRTKNTAPGNTSGIVMTINGQHMGSDGGDRAISQVRKTVRGAGEYTVQVVCTNTRADADTCQVTPKKVDTLVF